MIKAKVAYRWDHPNHKFFPGDVALVGAVHESNSQRIKDHVGQEGVVVARSTSQEGDTARSAFRQFTRYYLSFDDGAVLGIDSCYLRKIGD